MNVSGLTSGVATITAGNAHTCVVTTTGGAKCWGNGVSGQLGATWSTRPLPPVSPDGGDIHALPLNVSGLTSGVATIAAGGDHTCVLTSAGGMKCWGGNYYGELGDGTTVLRKTPVNVTGLTSGVLSIAAGGMHTCARISGGSTKCWGYNYYGQLGDGTTTNRLVPTDVTGMSSGVTVIAAGGYVSGNNQTCALNTSGIIKCWGKNNYGQVGDGSTINRVIPTEIAYLVLLTYTDAAHKHAVTSLSTGETYTYDANGNMITRVEGGVTYNQVFDAENRLVSVTTGGQTTRFVYNGDGKMVEKINPDGSKTIYAAEGLYEVDKTSAGSVTRTVTYYPAGGAMRINSSMYYILKDSLGSASMVTDSSGTVVGEQRYYPFGETRLSTGTMFTDKLFTGQQEVTGLGLYNYGARFYSPKIGHFITADTIVPDPYNPQDWNRYTYARNNPVRHTDPSGHVAWDGDEGSSKCNDPDFCENGQVKPYAGIAYTLKLAQSSETSEERQWYQNRAVALTIDQFGIVDPNDYKHPLHIILGGVDPGDPTATGRTSYNPGVSPDIYIHIYGLALESTPGDLAATISHEFCHANQASGVTCLASPQTTGERWYTRDEGIAVNEVEARQTILSNLGMYGYGLTYGITPGKINQYNQDIAQYREWFDSYPGFYNAITTQYYILPY